MGTLLDNGRYQVLENLTSQPGYSASICIDVEVQNNYKPLIFNTYSEPGLINTYLPLYYSISPGDCADFHRVIPGDRCIMAVFSYHSGTPLTEHLLTIGKNKKDYPAGAKTVASFLDAAITLDMLPPVFALSALTPPNTVYDAKSSSVLFNFIIKPREATAEQLLDEKRSLFLGYLENMLPKNRYLPYEAEDFLERMRSADISKFVPICAEWREISPKAMKEYEGYLKESIFAYLKRRVRRWLQKRKQQRGK